MKKNVFFVILICFFVVANLVFAQEQKENAPQQTEKVEKEKKDPLMLGREINDIPIFENFWLDKESTFLFQAKGIKVGILTYKGKLELYKALDGLRDAMIKEGWTMQNVLSYKNTVNMNFTKDDRSCNAFIEEGFVNTKIELRVGLIAK